jgi:cyclin B
MPTMDFGMDVDMADSAPATLPAGVDDIDRNDFNDPQMVSDYVTEIHAYMHDLEVQQCPLAGYMAGVQTEIKPEMRAILVDWLVEVHARFKLIPETLQLTVNIMDRYLTKENTKRKELQLIGVTAMLIACKYEEMYPPEVRDFIWIADNAYSRQQIIAMEGAMLKTLDYDLGTPLPTQFFERGAKACGAAANTKMMSTYFMELSLCSYEMVQYTPSQKASAALCLSRQVLQQGPWTPTLAHFMDYTEAQLAPVVQALHTVVQSSVGAKQQAIRTKYKRSKFDEISENAQLKSFIR